ncbi:hypothetical protein BGZ83_002471 [Gryganskiella cystojenkinii]|nr:hypothetical protein BGZ83_002471 [Gryganskiella cystojenkinii]
MLSNLHFLSVYRSSLIHNSMSMLMVFSFILPLSLVVPVAVRKQIENPGFGSICFVSSDAASAFFFYPLSVVVCLATLLHLGTIAFMIRTSLQANKNSASHSVSAVSDGNNPSAAPRKRLQTARDISLLLKQQWRPGLFAKLLDVKPTTQWFADWIACLGQQAKISFQSGLLSATSTPDQIKTAGETAQRICASVAEQNVPNFAWAALTDLLPAMFGIMILIIFGSRLELWQDLRKKLFGSRGSSRVAGGTGGNSGSGGSKIMMQDVHSREPKKMERPRRDYSTTYRVEDGLHDEDLQQDDNPYGSRTNLALSPSVNAIGSKNGSGTKMTGTNRIGDHRLDTPEPWKPIAWPPSVTGKQQDDMYDPTFRSASPQLRINTNTNRSYQKPQQQSSSGMARAMSPISPSRQNGFYNFEEIDAAPVSLTTPPPTYSHGSPLKPGSPSSRVFAPGNRPISPHRATEATGAGGDQVVVAEASRVRLNYRISSDARQFMTSPQPRLQQQQSQQQQGQRQQTFDPMEPSTRAMSPSPTVPQKSRARPMKNGV